MREMGYTFEDIRRMSPRQLSFLAESIKLYYKEQEKAIRRARRRV